MELPVEPVPSRAIDRETGDVFLDHKLAEHEYERSWLVLDGGEFEEKLLAARHPAGSYRESYLRMKLAKARADPAYAERAQGIGADNTTILLALCRWCSYAGGPGMPELVLVNGRRWALRYLSSALLPEQKLFALLAQAAIPSIDIGIGRVVPASSDAAPSKLPVEAAPLLRGVLAARGEAARALAATIKATEAEIRGLEGQAAGPAMAATLGALTVQKDELAWLLHQELGMPFALLEKWQKGPIRPEEIRERALQWEREVREEQELFERLAAEARAEPAFATIGRFKNEETVRRKVAWLQERFGIGESRAKQLYGYIEG